jgi:hypothetical protein
MKTKPEFAAAHGYTPSNYSGASLVDSGLRGGVGGVTR